MELSRLKLKKLPYPPLLKKKKFLFFGEWNFPASSPKKTFLYFSKKSSPHISE